MHRPYTPEQSRVCDYLREITHDQVGCGDDPIGFLIASHQMLRQQRQDLQAVAATARECLHDDRHAGGDVTFKMGGHRRIRLANALKALDAP